MKFGKQLLEELVPDWSSKYVDYKFLKQHISRVLVAQGVIPTKKWMVKVPSQTEASVDHERDSFKIELLKQLDTVDHFYSQLRNFFLRKYSYLHRALKSQKRIDLQTLLEIRFRLKIWKQFVVLNYTAVRKIVKKYDKKTNYTLSESVLNDVQHRTFYSSKDIQALDELLCKLIKENSQNIIDDNLFCDLEELSFTDSNHRQNVVLNLSDEFEISTFSVYLYPFQLSRFYSKKTLVLLSKFSLTDLLLISGTILLFQIFLLYLFKTELQRSSMHLTLFLKQFQHPWIDLASDFIHHKISTGNWLLLCLMFVWFNPTKRKWVDMYSFVSVGFVVKSISKNFIQAPRGFWLWDQGASNYCGKGFSLPSGHAMVSLCVLSFLVMKIRSPILLMLAFVLELIIFFNVNYIGTHTFMDVFVAWVFTLFLLSLWMKTRRVFEFLSNQQSSIFSKLGYRGMVLMLGLVLVIASDFVELYIHPESFPPEYVQNMQNFCGYEYEHAVSRLDLKLYFTNTPLIIGIMIGHFLNDIFISESHAGIWDNVWKRSIMCLLGGYLFVSFFWICRMTLKLLDLPQTWASYTHNLFSPIVMLFLWPFLYMNILKLFSNIDQRILLAGFFLLYSVYVHQSQ